MTTRFRTIPWLLLAILLCAAPAEAGDPEANDIIRSLAPITYLPEHGGPPRRAIDLEVSFELGSARLTPAARQLLDRLGAALKNERLAASRFEIVGHTDASGRRDFNQVLSERRARSVRAYLVKTHGIAPERLTALGKGEDALKDPLRPRASVNRRVEVVNLTPVQPAAGAEARTNEAVEKKAKDILTGN